jgi:prepilin signal peptidase PulO-like enzyme (type II secretory pathway)
MQVVFLIMMFVIGACVGSFLCCEARRTREKELGRKKFGPRSICLKCGHRLSWYENIPILSWIVLRGRCRRCKTRIGYLEIFSEVATAIIMTLIATTIDITNADLIDWLLFGSLFLLTSALVFLALYDGMYGELPVGVLAVAAAFALFYSITRIINGETDVVGAIISAVILGGLYLVLFSGSRGKWVGDGDWILAGIIGFALGQPFFALLTLFISNFSACVIMWPYVRKSKSHKIYFGPFLVFGFIVSLLVLNYGIISI